jgi:hypothetical protein
VTAGARQALVPVAAAADEQQAWQTARGDFDPRKLQLPAEACFQQ